jgi:hypothetical protein
MSGNILFDNGMVLPIDTTPGATGYLSAQSLFWHSSKFGVLTVDGGSPSSDFPGTSTPGLAHFWHSGSTSIGVSTGSWGGVGGNSAQIAVIGSADAEYGIRCPMSDSEWQAAPYISPWGSMFGCQELASPAVGSGSSPFNLATTASLELGAHETNWTRRFFHAHTAFDTGMMAGNGLGPDIRTAGAVAVLGYLKIRAALAVTPILGYVNGTTNGPQEPFALMVTTAGKVRLSVSGSTTPDSVNDYRNVVHPFLLVYDPTNSRAKLYTDLEKVTGSYQPYGSASPLAIFKGFGANNQNSPSGSMCYLAFCTGSVAAALSDDGKASVFLKNLGWVVPW